MKSPTIKALGDAYDALFKDFKVKPTVIITPEADGKFIVTLGGAADVMGRVFAKITPEPGVFVGVDSPVYRVEQTQVQPLSGEGENRTLVINHILYTY